MLFRNLLTPDNQKVDWHFSQGAIEDGVKGVSNAANELDADLEGDLVFPGLINSHDHLDFNLFSLMGDGPYTSYRAWGEDIHRKYKTEMEAVLKVPFALRYAWGMYKNLLNGVTTVMNHGNNLDNIHHLLNVVGDCHVLHSVGFEKSWWLKLNYPLHFKKPYAIHIGEGTDAESKREITQLVKGNLFRKTMIGIHGVAMNNTQAKAFKGVIWCPASNEFLLRQHAPIAALKQHTSIGFGTDSTLTATWNIWEQLRYAQSLRQLTDQELFDAVQKNALKIWGLNEDTSKSLSASQNFVVASGIKDHDFYDSFFQLNPQRLLMVVCKGRIVMLDKILFDRNKALLPNLEHYRLIAIAGVKKYVIGDLPALVKKILEYYPAAQFPFEVI